MDWPLIAQEIPTGSVRITLLLKEMIAGGFTPTPLHEVNEYIPSIQEVGIALGLWALGFLVLTALFTIAAGVKEEVHG